MQQKRGELEQKAMKYRRLAREITDRQTVEWILALANELEARSARPETISRDDQGPDRDGFKKYAARQRVAMDRRRLSESPIVCL